MQIRRFTLHSQLFDADKRKINRQEFRINL